LNKPQCKLIGEDGNVFNIIGRVRKALKEAGKHLEAREFTKRAFESKSYGEVLRLANDYVKIT